MTPHVVVGAGPVGTAVVESLREAGRAVTVVTRSGTAPVPADVDVVAADVTDADAAREACADADVVYNCVGVPYAEWGTVLPRAWEGLVRAAEAADAVLVCADNCYAYGPADGPIHEALPWATETRKGRVRADIARDVLDAHEAGRIRAVVARASDFYGPRVRNSIVGEGVFENLLRGKRANVLGDPDAPHTYTYVPDFAAALVTLGASERALGEVWHVPSPPTLSTREFVELVAEEAGVEPRMRAAPGWMLRLVGTVSPTLRELSELRYEFEEPFVVSHEKFDRAFGADPTPHRVAIAETVAWYREALDG